MTNRIQNKQDFGHKHLLNQLLNANPVENVIVYYRHNHNDNLYLLFAFIFHIDVAHSTYKKNYASLLNVKTRANGQNVRMMTTEMSLVY